MIPTILSPRYAEASLVEHLFSLCRSLNEDLAHRHGLRLLAEIEPVDLDVDHEPDPTPGSGYLDHQPVCDCCLDRFEPMSDMPEDQVVCPRCKEPDENDENDSRDELSV